MGKVLGETHYSDEEKNELIEKLCIILMNGSSRRIACSLIGLPISTLAYWLDNDEKIRTKVDTAESFLEAKAEEVVKTSIIMGDANSAKWWLEHRSKDRYNTQTTTVLDTKTIEQREALTDILKDLTNEPSQETTNDKAVS